LDGRLSATCGSLGAKIRRGRRDGLWTFTSTGHIDSGDGGGGGIGWDDKATRAFARGILEVIGRRWVDGEVDVVDTGESGGSILIAGGTAATRAGLFGQVLSVDVSRFAFSSESDLTLVSFIAG
jgi:hypothetical protein